MAIKTGSKLLSALQTENLLIIGENMQAIRKRKGWTLEKMEEQGFKNWTHYKALESGKKNMTISTFILACSALETTPNKLLKGVTFDT